MQAIVNGMPWTIDNDLISKIEHDGNGNEVLPIDSIALRKLRFEQECREENKLIISELKDKDKSLWSHPTLMRWERECQLFTDPLPEDGEKLTIDRVMGDPAWAKELMAFTKALEIRFAGDAYGYTRAFANSTKSIQYSGITVLDPTAGGGSIPFEALRLGHKVIANELNPVATTILYATLQYPALYGLALLNDIQKWGTELIQNADRELCPYHPDNGPLPSGEQESLRQHIRQCPEIFPQFNQENVVDYLYVRQVTCPHCAGEAPLLNTCWLSKEAKDLWGVEVIPDGKPRGGKVKFETYRVVKGKGPRGQDPNFATVNRGVGQCIHCKQAISGDEIKAQARGESPHGKWIDRLYCVVAVRWDPELDKHGKPKRYKSGPNKGEIRKKKVRFFRAPNERDLKALEDAERRLMEKWPEWERDGLIPTEKLPLGQKTSEPLRYGMPRWCDLFTPRQLLGHLTLIEELNRLKPQILDELGMDRGRAVVTYLQFAMAKGYNYNSRLAMWHATRGTVANTFNKHDFSLKWTNGEMIFTGPQSGAAWGLNQVLDAYGGIAKLLDPVNQHTTGTNSLPLEILSNNAAHLPSIQDSSVDLVCMDPPYYDNVQYGELSDYFYVWQKRVLGDLYPGLFVRRLVNKTDEAVANPAREGSKNKAKTVYERMMKEIFQESRRVLKDDGIMTLMFTHKTQDAWESLTRSLIVAGWTITASFPIESEAASSLHQRDMAAAASSVFLACRKRSESNSIPAFWSGLGGQGVQHKIRDAVEQGLTEFANLKLNPVDEMVACYGRALHVLSEQWPVMDGDEEVGPIRAMNEASRVVAANQIKRITSGRLTVADLDPETAVALIAYGMWGLNPFPYDEALNLSHSLNVSLEAKSGGYRIEGNMIGINQEAGGRRGRSRAPSAEENGYHAPLLRSGSKLRLAHPEERNDERLERPKTDWDVLHGLIQSYRESDVTGARPYLEKHAKGHEERILDLLDVWATEMVDPELRREAETLHFGLKGS